MADNSPITLALFWSKVDIPSNVSECWQWTRRQTDNGYGRFRHKGKWYAAHRVSYEILNGEIPEGLQVRHLCHNRLCCNPAHLAVGTAKQNVQDSIEAGRFTKGSVNGNSKLTDDEVIYIRRNPDKLTGRELAQRFGISPATVSGIKNCRVWRHVAA